MCRMVGFGVDMDDESDDEVCDGDSKCYNC